MILLLLLIVVVVVVVVSSSITAIEFSLGGSSLYTSTDKTNNIHKRNNTKHSKYKNTY